MSFAARMVYVGVGGTGLEIGRSLEQLLRDEITGPDGRRLKARGGSFEEFMPFQLPGFVQSLYLDFSEQEIVTLQNELAEGSGDVAAKTATFIRSLSNAGHASSDVTNLLRSSTTAAPIVESWLPPKMSDWGNEPTFAPLATGAGQYPTIGRAALFAFMERFGAEAIMRDIRRPLESINASMGQLEEYTGNANPSRTVYFLVGGSLSGGTGGGIFTDIIRLVSHAAQEKLGATPFVVVPLVLLPSAFDHALAPGKRKNATLNAIRGLTDLGFMIDEQNAPSTAGEKATAFYPDGGNGKGVLTTILPDASVKAAFVFHRPVDVPSPKALAERAARFAINLLRQPSSAKSGSSASTGRTMILMDKLVNNSALLYEPHPTYLGRRPFASSACVALSDGREFYISHVAKQLVAAAYSESQNNLSPEERSQMAYAMDKELKISPPLSAPINPNLLLDIKNDVSPTVAGITTKLGLYEAALNGVASKDGKGTGGVVPDWQSAGAANAYEAASRPLGSNKEWVGVVRGASARFKKDVFSVLSAAEFAADNWTLGNLAGPTRRQVDIPAITKLVEPIKAGFLSRTIEFKINEAEVKLLDEHEAWRVDANWRSYLRNNDGKAQRFKESAAVLQRRLRSVKATLDEWAKEQTESKQKNVESALVQKLGVSRDLSKLTANVIRKLSSLAGQGEASPVIVGRSVLLRCQDQALERWLKIDQAAPELLIVRVLEAVEAEVSRVFEDPEVYPALGHILREWAKPDAKEMSSEVRSFQSRLLASISDAFIPPTTDRDVEPMISVAYPEESNKDVELKLKEALASHPALERFLRQTEPTFIPRSASNAIVISVVIVGQGLMDIEGGATGLNTWIEAAFRPEPTDRLAWRQRTGYRDPIAFIEGDLKVGLVQRLLAAAWNNELRAKRNSNPGAGQFDELVLQFASESSTTLNIPLDRMPFSNYLAPMLDAWLREITRRWSADTIAVSEILRELSRCIPVGFVERYLPEMEHFARNDYFLFEFDEKLNKTGAGHRERQEFDTLMAELKKQGNHTLKRRHQIQEYADFWSTTVPAALERSFGTLGYGSLREAIDELAEREAKRSKN